MTREQLTGGHWTLSQIEPAMADVLVTRLSWLVANNPLVDWSIHYPADWWEALKDRWAPKWAQRRWPVRYITHRVEARELATKLALPEKFGPAVVMQVTQGEDSV